MSGTYSQIYIQIVFAVKGRENLIDNSWGSDLHKYITGIIRAKGQKSIIVNGVSDHIHAFIGLRPATSIADVTRDIKCNSSKFINDRQLVPGKFQWQEGYGAFSYSHSQIGQLYDYIFNQQKLHTSQSFKDEYIGMLKAFEIKSEANRLFEWYE